MTVIGYLLIFAYIFLLIFVLGTLVQKISNGETSRKFIHIMLFMVWILIDRFLKGTIHQIIIPTAFIFLNILSYRFSICKTIERKDGNHLGTIYFAIAITIILTIAYFVPDFYLPSGIAVMCLTFGDGFAALIGYNFSSAKIYHKKSIFGFLSAFVASTAALFLFNWFYEVHLSIGQIILLGLGTAILELFDWGLDNFSIVFGTFFLSYAFLHAPKERMVLSVAMAMVIFLIVFFTHAISYYGSLWSMVIVFIFSYFGGAFALGFLLATYFTVFFISFGKKFFLHHAGHGHGRRTKQILINGGLGTLLVLLYHLTSKEYYLLVAIVSVSGCFVDSLSSDVGVLSPRPPYDPLRRKSVPAGLSGGMSILGTLAALVGSAAISLALGTHFRLLVIEIVIITAVIFSQTIVDTFLGSAFQVKYRCTVCRAITEKRKHCGRYTTRASGISWIDNNMVNLLSSIIVTALALFVCRF